MLGCEAQKPVTTTVPSTASATNSIDANQPEVLIDVRSDEEWQTGHLSKAKHIPFDQIGDRIAEITTDKDAKIVVYCKAGGRAEKAKNTLENLGFVNVTNAGGYDDIKSNYE